MEAEAVPEVDEWETLCEKRTGTVGSMPGGFFFLPNCMQIGFSLVVVVVVEGNPALFIQGQNAPPPPRSPPGVWLEAARESQPNSCKH